MHIYQVRVCMASRKQEHIEHITERCLIAQENFSFKERAERDGKYWCKRCRHGNRQFPAPSAMKRDRAQSLK